MFDVLKKLEPDKVFYYFGEISKIPRCSSNEKLISDYLYDLAKDKGWEVFQDESFNIIIKKPGTKGYENAPTVILQGHMDMVCDKNEDVIHDFGKDPIRLRVVDDYIYATDTTLGADNGIAIAMSLAILDSDDIPHPSLEVLITTDEETGMTGAKDIDERQLNGKILLNLDSEGEGIFTVGCAGGARAILRVPIIKVLPKCSKTYKLSIKGLKGGHSGVDIHLERANANKLLGRVLYDLYQKENISLASINGGSKDNAIPRSSEAIIVTKDIKKVNNIINKWNAIFDNEYKITDENIRVTIKEIDSAKEVFDESTTKKIISAINLIPYGPLVRSTEIDLVIYSNNLGVVITNDDYVELKNAPRSSTSSLISYFQDVLEQLANSLNIEYIGEAFYPGWQFESESKIRKLCKKTYKEVTGKKPEILAIHAGLECGLLIEKINNLDAISIGPDIIDAHSPNEHVSISSVKRTYDFMCEILKNIDNSY